MTRTLKTLLIPTMFLTDCCSYDYDKEDFLLTDSELSHFSSFTIGDTIYYESASHDIDTLLILDIEPTNKDPDSACGKGLFMNPRPANVKSITIKRLPIDKWHGTSTAISQDGTTKKSVNYQALFTVYKFPLDKEVEYSISFKDFHSRGDSVIGDYHTDPIILNNQEWTNYFKVEHGYPERLTDSTDIELVYWTAKEGLIAYKNKGGQIWTRR